jgi:hypothetical protein
MYLDRYQEAGDVVKDTIRDYPATFTFIQQLPFVEAIFIKHLKQTDQAINIYRTIIDMTDDDRLQQAMHEQIEKLR